MSTDLNSLLSCKVVLRHFPNPQKRNAAPQVSAAPVLATPRPLQAFELARYPVRSKEENSLLSKVSEPTIRHRRDKIEMLAQMTRLLSFLLC
jgi:hypothetical protein